jgi:hypothetical protein
MWEARRPSGPMVMTAARGCAAIIDTKTGRRSSTFTFGVYISSRFQDWIRTGGKTLAKYRFKRVDVFTD